MSRDRGLIDSLWTEQQLRFFLLVQLAEWRFGSTLDTWFLITPWQTERAVGDNGGRERGTFPRDECLVIATRETSCSVPGNPRVSSFRLSPFLWLYVPFPPSKLAPKPRMGALPMHRCASVDWTFWCSLETAASPQSFGIYIDEYDAVCPNVHWLVSIALHWSFFFFLSPLFFHFFPQRGAPFFPPLSSFSLDGHRNFSRRVERFFYSQPFLRRNEAFWSDGTKGWRVEKMSIGLSARHWRWNGRTTMRENRLPWFRVWREQRMTSCSGG